MKRAIHIMCVAVVVFVVSIASAAEIETVPVGNPGNTGELSGVFPEDRVCGAVDYRYNIGTYEVTAGQYIEFLNAVAGTDTYGLYSSEMDIRDEGCQITQNGSDGSYTYDFSGRPSGAEADWTDRPVNYVSWGDAARFANWLHNGQPTGTLTGDPVQDAGLTEDGSYDLDGATTGAALLAVTRNAEATWAIPSEDEWYKAAYYDPSLSSGAGGYYDYPTSSNSVPSNAVDGGGNNATIDDSGFTIGTPYYRTEVGAHGNSESPYDTFDQGGNVWEWNEAIFTGMFRGMRGGSFDMPHDGLLASSRHPRDPSSEFEYLGFRVSEVPEPATMAILALGGLAVLRKRRKQ